MLSNQDYLNISYRESGQNKFEKSLPSLPKVLIYIVGCDVEIQKFVSFLCFISFAYLKEY